MRWWVILLIVITSLAVLIIWLLSRYVRAVLAYDGEITVTLRFLFIRYDIYPKKERAVRASDYSLKKLRRREKKASKPAKKSDVRTQEKKSTADGAKDVISTLTAVSEYIVDKIKAHGRVDVKRLDVVVATDDAAKTGIWYGVIAQSVAYLTSILGAATEVHADNVNVAADFLKTETSVAAEIIFSMRARHLLKIAFKTLFEGMIKNNENIIEENGNG